MTYSPFGCMERLLVVGAQMDIKNWSQTLLLVTIEVGSEAEVIVEALDSRRCPIVRSLVPYLPSAPR